MRLCGLQDLLPLALPEYEKTTLYVLFDFPNKPLRISTEKNVLTLASFYRFHFMDLAAVLKPKKHVDKLTVMQTVQ